MINLICDDVILVTGGGGFIGGHLVADLIASGCPRIRAVDIKPFAEWHQVFPEAENIQLDFREKEVCFDAVRGARYVFNLAAANGRYRFHRNAQDDLHAFSPDQYEPSGGGQA